MCKILFEEEEIENNIGIILYNYLFSKSYYQFTLKKLYKDLMDLGIHIEEKIIKKRIHDLLVAGLLIQSLDGYSI